MRIVIDMQGMQTGSRYRGIGRYTKSIVHAIIRNGQEHEIFLLINGLFPETVPDLIEEFSKVVPREQIKIWDALGPTARLNPENEWRQIAASYIRSQCIKKISPDIVLLTTVFEGYGDNFICGTNLFGNGGLNTAAIVYDLIPLMNPMEYLADSHVRDWYDAQLEILKSCNLLLAISESSRNECLNLLDLPGEKIFNISSAVEPQFQECELSIAEEEDIRNKFDLKKEYLMYSGATDPRKNHIRLIQAYAKLPKTVRRNHQLAIVGGMPDEHKEEFKVEIKRCGLTEKEVRLVGRVDDESLVLLYNLCKGYIFPSWHEGFGLPALEAIKCGRPVIASNTSSIPEVVGDQNALFDPFNTDEMAFKIEMLLTDELYREKLIMNQREHSKQFSWDITARIAIDAMLQVTSLPSINRYEVQETCFDYSQLGAALSKYQSNIIDRELQQLAILLAQNEQGDQRRELLIDVSELIKHDAHTGIQRVTRALLKEILGMELENFHVRPVYAKHDQEYRYAQFIPGVSQENLEGAEEAVRGAPGDIFLGLDLIHPDILKSNRLNLEKLRLRGVNTIFIVYDLIPLLYPHFANIGVPEGHAQWLDIVTEADGVICISKAVANEVRQWLLENKKCRVDNLKIDHFNLGGDIENSIPTQGEPSNASAIQNIIDSRPTFLMVGTLEPRKGHQQTLEAFSLLWEKGFDVNLVLVGKLGWKAEELLEKIEKSCEFNKRLMWINDASDEYLKKLYRQSTALIAASYCEGFGLPLVEAARHALPLIVRDIAVFKEVAGDHAFYFPNSSEPKVISDAIERWYTSWQLGDFPSSEGMKVYTWRQSMLQLWDCIRTMDDNSDMIIHTLQ